MSSGKVVCGVFFPGNQLFWMKQLAVGSGSHLVDDGRLQVNEDGARHMLASTSLREESVEGIVTTSNRFVTGHLTIGLDAVLETEQFPACVSNLHARLADVDANAFTHGCFQS